MVISRTANGRALFGGAQVHHLPRQSRGSTKALEPWMKWNRRDAVDFRLTCTTLKNRTLKKLLIWRKTVFHGAKTRGSMGSVFGFVCL